MSLEVGVRALLIRLVKGYHLQNRFEDWLDTSLLYFGFSVISQAKVKLNLRKDISDMQGKIKVTAKTGSLRE